MTERELLTTGLRELGVVSDPSAADLLKFRDSAAKNKVMNLTAVTDPIVTRHFSIARHLHRICRRMEGARCGNGSRFSGHAAGDSVPADRVCPVDALRKRIDFLNEVIAELGLTNVTAVHARRRITPETTAARLILRCRVR